MTKDIQKNTWGNKENIFILFDTEVKKIIMVASTFDAILNCIDGEIEGHRMGYIKKEDDKEFSARYQQRTLMIDILRKLKKKDIYEKVKYINSYLENGQIEIFEDGIYHY